MKTILLWVVFIILLTLTGAVTLIGLRMYEFTRPVSAAVISTAWTESVDADNPLPLYPRPQLRRSRWQNLNGRWRFNVVDRDAAAPVSFDSEIVVPFAIESMLSGVQRPLQPDEKLWYTRSFKVEKPAGSDRVLLHFGAVDWEAQVWINGHFVGDHRGGYAPFTFDITDSLTSSGTASVIVSAWDPTNLGPGAYGKQHLVPHGIRYTAVSGIWQTVWLETVPESRIESLVSQTNLAAGEVTLQVDVTGAMPGDTLEAIIYAGERALMIRQVAVTENTASMVVPLDELRLWSPEDPFLHDVTARLVRAGEALDSVESYFGARQVSVATDQHGIDRLFLNGKPIFHLGLLDQGWWPDGLYTAPTDEALAFDVAATKRMGFNTIRKHVKVEPARWYWHADRLGVLVWQDMPTGDGGDNRYGQIVRQTWDILWSYLRGSPVRPMTRGSESEALFEIELRAMMNNLKSFTSIVAWVPFNEGWGQFDTGRILAEVAALDPERLVDGPSGWFDMGAGDILDLHMYGREQSFPDQLPPERPVVYGEFGGLGLPIDGHLSVDSGWGYAAFKDDGDYLAAYTALMATVRDLVPRGLSGAIYTQTTDVESEINGLLTYDRKVFKIPPERLAELNQKVISNIETDLAPHSRH